MIAHSLTHPRARAHGFTLIELVAVVATFALIAAMVLPNLDLGGRRAVGSAANDLATSIELARERAILTGRVHAVIVDIDADSYWIEWAKPPEPAAVAPAAAHGPRQLELVPPPLEGEALEPLFGSFGRPHHIEDPVAILSVEIEAGIADAGSVQLRMDADGATDRAAIVLGEPDGSHAMRVEVEPLADAVVVTHVE